MRIDVSYILKNEKTGRLSYRRRYPLDLQPFIAHAQGTTSAIELKRSLGGTRYPHEPESSRYIAATAEYAAIIERAEKDRSLANRAARAGFREVTKELSAFLLESYRANELALEEEVRWSPESNSGRYERVARWQASQLADLSMYRGLRAAGDMEGIFAAWRAFVLDFASALDILLDDRTDAFRELCRNFNDAAIETCGAILKRLAGDDVPTPPLPKLSEALNDTSTAVALTETFDSYAASKGIAPGVAYEWRRVVQHLVAFLGHDNAGRLTTDDLLRWRDQLLQEPSKQGGARSPLTVRGKYLAAVKAMLRWSVQERKLTSNVADAVVVHVPKRLQLRERDFTDDEASAILTATLRPPSGKLLKGYTLALRWVPWLAAYTGARVNELGQLRKQDVFQQDGIWAVRITPEAGTVKGKAARLVPLHPHIIEQGFLEVVASLEDAPLFYEPSRQRSSSAGNRQFKKVGERIAKWVREDVGIQDPNIDPSHAWRHTFKTQALAAGIPERVADAIQGHSAKTVARGYGSVPLATMAKEIAKSPRFKINIPCRE